MQREEGLDVFSERRHVGSTVAVAFWEQAVSCTQRAAPVNTTLLILLVGEMLVPFQGDFRDALPLAFPEGVPEVALGMSAPPGRTVAWVTLQPSGLEIEVVLHTARVPGDLRRVLRFSASDAPRDRAKAAAFTLAAMVREREADLEALEPKVERVVEPAPPSAPPALWLLEASLLVGINVPHVDPGGGLRVALRRELSSWLQLGVGVEAGLFSATAAALVQPALYLEGAVPLVRGDFSLSAVVGGGVAAPVLIRGQLNFTTWLPLLRVGAEGRVRLGAHHGLRFALSGHFHSSSLSVRVGETVEGGVGPAWIRPEVGFFGEL
jgi:hypothetical protein